MVPDPITTSHCAKGRIMIGGRGLTVLDNSSSTALPGRIERVWMIVESELFFGARSGEPLSVVSIGRIEMEFPTPGVKKRKREKEEHEEEKRATRGSESVASRGSSQISTRFSGGVRSYPWIPGFTGARDWRTGIVRINLRQVEYRKSWRSAVKVSVSAVWNGSPPVKQMKQRLCGLKPDGRNSTRSLYLISAIFTLSLI